VSQIVQNIAFLHDWDLRRWPTQPRRLMNSFGPRFDHLKGRHCWPQLCACLSMTVLHVSHVGEMVFVVLMSMPEASDKSVPFHTFAFEDVSNNNVSDQDRINQLWTWFFPPWNYVSTKSCSSGQLGYCWHGMAICS
jgi:hypothetical protein